MDAINEVSANVPMSVEEFKKADHKKKVRFGIIMGLFCALYWGVWYIPGYAIWGFTDLIDADCVVGLGGAIIAEKGVSSDTAYLLQCLFLTCINATACALVLFIWNGALGKMREWKRTLLEVKAASKYFMLAGICGAVAVYGTYIAAAFLSPGFAAVAGLLYPIIGTIMSVLYLKQKVSKRGYLAIIVLLAGGITLYVGSMIAKGVGEGNVLLGCIGGIMAAVGWGFEGVVAGKALDICEPDVGLHLRFCFETVFWWIVILVLMALGFPMLDTIGEIANPSLFIAVLMIGLSFAWCYVTWYKSFPFLGVARGQAVGSLYAACAVIFLIIFFGPAGGLGYDGLEDSAKWIIIGSTIAGLIICLIGSYLIATEDSEGMVSLKDTSIVLGGEKE